MKSVGFKLKDESKAIKIIRIAFYVIAGCYFLYDFFFSMGFFLFKAEFRYYTVPMLIFCAFVLAAIIFVRFRLYITSSVLMTVSCIGKICIGFMMRNPGILPNGMTHDRITKEMFMGNFLPVLLPFLAMIILLIPAILAKRGEIIEEKQTYTPQFK